MGRATRSAPKDDALAARAPRALGGIRRAVRSLPTAEQELGSFVSVMEARANFSETVNRTAFGHERLVIERHGKAVAALVPIEDLQRLRDLEDREDVEAARRALADPTETPIPFERVREDLRALDRLEAVMGREAALAELERRRTATEPRKRKPRRA